MLTIMLMLGAAAQTPAEPPLIPAFFTAQTLYDICTRPNHGQCSMYVAGVIDGVFLTEARTAEPTICRAAITNQKAAELVTAYLTAHPERRAESAASAVKAAVADALPCNATEPYTG
ncbi:MAG TPA: Rap1a/Tai family immunity protein [Sphingomonas sp.]|nr:Rap1a/Tai family immunity protein [Sphingomonas sp.]